MTAALARAVGGIISSLGVMATFLKYSAEIYASEVDARTAPVLSFQTTSSPHPVDAPSGSNQPVIVCKTCGTSTRPVSSIARSAITDFRPNDLSRMRWL